MTALPRLARLLASADRWAGRVAFALAVYALGGVLVAGRNLVGVGLSTPGLVLEAALALLLLAGAVAAIVVRPPTGSGRTELAVRLSRALLRLGAALVIAGVPASLAEADRFSLQVGEGQPIGPESAPGLPALDARRVTVSPQGAGLLLSKQVALEASDSDGRTITIPLFPPARLGAWRLSVMRFGYAPAVEWRDAAGDTIADGWLLLGTFPHTEEEGRLVTWAPEPNVMMGVGTFPPKLEDLVTPPGTALHLFLRIDEAGIAGAHRDLRAPDAWRFVMDGRLEQPTCFAQVFEGRRKLWEGRLRPGEEAVYPGGRLKLPGDVRMWVELDAVRDPWLPVAMAGAVLVIAGAALGAAARVRRAMISRHE